MKKSSTHWTIGIVSLLIFLSYLVYFLRQVDVSLLYYWQQSITAPFHDYLKYPGGLSDMAGIWFTDFLVRLSSGVPAIIVLTCIVCISLYTIEFRSRKNPLFFVFLLGAMIPFIFLFSFYRLPVGLVISIVLSLAISALYSIIQPQKTATAIVLNFIIGIVLYLLSGPAGLAVFVVVILTGILRTATYKHLVSLLPVLLIPLGYMLFNGALRFKDAYLYSFMLNKYGEIPLILYFNLLSPLILFLLYKVINLIIREGNTLKSTFISIIGSIAVLLVLSLTARGMVNEPIKRLYSMGRAGLEENWDKVMELSDEGYLNNLLFQYDVNRALYGKKQLLDKLFSYPQPFGEKSIFLESNAGSHVSMHLADFYYDIGYVTEARHWANEANVMFMRHPIILKQLIMTYLAYDEVEIAKKYLRILSRSRLYREWAKNVSGMIDNKTFQNDPQIRFFLENNPEGDFSAGTKNPVEKLATFYRFNPSNHMAFEFLVAGYLLKHDVGNVMSLLPQFRNFGYKKLPVAVEEAIMIYLLRTNSKSMFLAGYKISQETENAFREFNTLMAKGATMSERKANVSNYRTTYWYYVLFSSPYATK